MNSRKSLILVFFMLLSTQMLFAQEDTAVYNEKEQELEQELRVLLGSIRDAYDSQDFVKTIELSEKGRTVSNKPRFYNYYVAVSSNLGLALLQIGDTLQSINVFEESLNKAIRFQDTDLEENRRVRTLITANIDLANALLGTKQYDLAIKKYKEALQLTDKEDIAGLIILNVNIGEAFMEREMYSEAYPYILQADDLVTKLNVDAYTASVRLILGRYYFEQGEYKKALSRYEESIGFAESADYQEVLVQSYTGASESYAKIGDFKKAFEYSKKIDTLLEDKFLTDRIKAVQNATAQFKVNEVRRDAENRIQAEKLQAEIKRKDDLQYNTIKWSVVALCIAGILIILLYIGYNRRKRLNQALQAKNQIYLEEKEEKERLLIARNAMFSRISHELRTPMYGIVGISNLLLADEGISSAHQENIKSLKYSADYLLSLINNVLEMNRLNRSSNDALIDQSFNLIELCNHSVESARYISPEHKNEFKVDIDNQLKSYYLGDPVRITQVLINLLGNANKFTKKGKVGLTVNLLESSNEKHIIQFKISDNGRGIPKEKLKSIFDETKYLDHTSENEGTGLGLPISNRILKLFNSDLNIESETGKGTTITFQIALMPTSIYDATITNDLKKIESSKDLSGLDILIVEDNKINQMVTQKIIENLNGNPSIANTGEKAVKMVEKGTYDIILMDINMPPGIDGFEATKRIRTFDVSTPVIALTAVEQLELENRMESSSINEYLIKPFDVEKLVEVIFKSLQS